MHVVSCITRIFLILVYIFLSKNSKVQKRGKINLIGRLQLTTERMREEENEGIVQLRILRTQVQKKKDASKHSSTISYSYLNFLVLFNCTVGLFEWAMSDLANTFILKGKTINRSCELAAAVSLICEPVQWRRDRRDELVFRELSALCRA